MDNKEILEEFAINELEERVEFGLCGGGGDTSNSTIIGGCSQASNFCIER